ncbi:hypothetical protein SNOG_07239 [Parastagonospora nodorum SN15]|uniref:Uncharacterized protein n=1 Tax=Phaeosphaeria nodorum (strain SN15 / ATCC MYA-4574 / FGSC 10173) TaxID=321614 RepID=Q0ULX5_PHANO|nr:hypothetical protein SNOG_07239 [Parastagonospora nodorum SN15]EAT85890.1 hypothetical protein SNOG_07239 [Parastagonospora nodorum SN15]
MFVESNRIRGRSKESKPFRHIMDLGITGCDSDELRVRSKNSPMSSKGHSCYRITNPGTPQSIMHGSVKPGS